MNCNACGVEIAAGSSPFGLCARCVVSAPIPPPPGAVPEMEAGQPTKLFYTREDFAEAGITLNAPEVMPAPSTTYGEVKADWEKEAGRPFVAPKKKGSK